MNRVHGSLNDQALIYLQIAQMLEDDILRGVCREEEQVPSTNELAREYNINPATAVKGINLLVAEGVLYKRRGIGMFVAPGATAAGHGRSEREAPQGPGGAVPAAPAAGGEVPGPQ